MPRRTKTDVIPGAMTPEEMLAAAKASEEPAREPGAGAEPDVDYDAIAEEQGITHGAALREGPVYGMLNELFNEDEHPDDPRAVISAKEQQAIDKAKASVTLKAGERVTVTKHGAVQVRNEKGRIVRFAKAPVRGKGGRFATQSTREEVALLRVMAVTDTHLRGLSEERLKAGWLAYKDAHVELGPVKGSLRFTKSTVSLRTDKGTIAGPFPLTDYPGWRNLHKAFDTLPTRDDRAAARAADKAGAEAANRAGRRILGEPTNRPPPGTA